jgi:hypothetical protein
MSRLSRAFGLAVMMTVFAGARAADAQSSHLLIISGLGGQPEYSDAFYEWSVTLADAARKKHGLAANQVIYLGEDPARDSARINGKSTREAIGSAISGIAGRSVAHDQIFIVLIGHGTSTGTESKFSIPGVDLSSTQFDSLLAPLAGRRVAFVHAGTASGDFVEALSAPGRAIVTATRTGFERNEVIFPRYFVAAFAGEGADTDKDNRISLFEAFEYARQEVARSYEESKKIMTEHAQIDDNGDKKGSPIANAREGDGMLARAMFLAPTVSTAAATNPRLVALYNEKRSLEDRIEGLRKIKDSIPPAMYEDQLEKLLIDLAQKTQEIKTLEGKK